MRNTQRTSFSIRFLPVSLVAILAFVVMLLSQVSSVEAQSFPGYTLFPLSPLNAPIPANAVYTRDTQIGSFRQGSGVWDCPVYRLPVSENPPLVTITNTYSGRVERWPIPRSANPAAEDDGHLCVIHLKNGIVYEFFAAVWTGDTTMSAGGMVTFPINTTGISNPPNMRVTASGFSNTVGMIRREDFMNPADGALNGNTATIRHALTMALPWGLLPKNGYVAPAVGGEQLGSATSSPIPLGAQFALPRNLNVDSLNVDPFVKIILRAARDYGVYISDGSGTTNYGGKSAGSLEVEPGLLVQLYPSIGSAENYMGTVQSQVYNVIQQYGLFRISTGTDPALTNTPLPLPTTILPTMTAIPSATNLPRATTTPIPTTVGSTVVPTNPALQPSGTPLPTFTPAPATNIPLATVGVPTNVPPTNVPLPTSTTAPSGGAVGVRIIVPPTITMNTTFTANITLDNPAGATGGGVKAAQIECLLSPDNRLFGSNVIVGTVFSPNPIVINRNFPYSDWMYVTLTQSGSNPAVRVAGNVLSFKVRPASRGTGTISCNVNVIGADGIYSNIRVTPATFTVR